MIECTFPMGSGSNARYTPLISYVGIVKSVPFMASFEDVEVMRDASGVISEEKTGGAIYRDSAGRVRKEFRVQGEHQKEFELVVITDLEARTVLALDIAAKAVTRFTGMGPRPEEIPKGGWAFRGAAPEDTADHREIEGISCRKVYLVRWPRDEGAEQRPIGESWVSDDLKHVVLERICDAEREHIWRLYDIRRAEPPDSLFVVPHGYTEVVKSKPGSIPSK